MDNWMVWLIWGTIVFIIFLIIVGLSRKFMKKKIKVCEHNFIERGHFVCRDLPRLLWVCSKCGVAIHIPIHTRKQLEEIENE